MEQEIKATPLCMGCGGRIDCGGCRGLCWACYHRLAYQVRKGRTTWAEEVKKGTIRPALNTPQLKERLRQWRKERVDPDSQGG